VIGWSKILSVGRLGGGARTALLGSDDRLGPFPMERDVPALEGRRYLWTARAFAIGMFLSLCLNGALGFALASLSPLVRVEPMLLSFKDKSEQLVQVEPFTKGTRGFELMTEMMVRDYVLAREEVLLDEKEMRRRWGGGGVVAHRTSPEEYRRFIAESAEKYDELRKRRLARSVIVHRVSKIAEGYWQVEFSVNNIDSFNNRISDETWVASLNSSYLPMAVNFEDRYMNPLGFIVSSYSISQRN